MSLDELIMQLTQSISIVNIAKTKFELNKKDNIYLFNNDTIMLDEVKQVFYDFDKGIGGDIITFVMIYFNKTFIDAIMILANFIEFKIARTDVVNLIKNKDTNKQSLYKIYEDASKFYSSNSYNKQNNGTDYYDKRNLSQETRTKFRLGYALNDWTELYQFLLNKGYKTEEIYNAGLIGYSSTDRVYDKFKNRVMIPIEDFNNRCIAFGGRVLDDSKPKYLNSSDSLIFDKSRNLYALGIAKKSSRKGFIACEGYMDVISMHQAGFTNAIASLGTAFTDTHAKLIKSLRKDVFLAYDSDGPGQMATVKAIDKLSKEGINVRIINMLPCKDPDEFINQFGAAEFEKRIKKSTSAYDFMVKYYTDQINESADLETKNKSLKNLAMYLSKN